MKSRLKKKLRRNSILIIDQGSIPYSMDVDEWYKCILDFGIIFYTRNEIGETNIPRVVPARNIKAFKVIERK